MKVGRPVGSVATTPGTPLRVGIPGVTFTVGACCSFCNSDGSSCSCNNHNAQVQWKCGYSCTGTVVDGLRCHSWFCHWWRAEGRNTTPF